VKAPGEWPERIGSLLIEIHGTEGQRQAGIDEMMGISETRASRVRKHEAHWSAVCARRGGQPPRRPSLWLLWSSRGTPVLFSPMQRAQFKVSLGASA
jgi:hypothetical protein